MVSGYPKIAARVKLIRSLSLYWFRDNPIHALCDALAEGIVVVLDQRVVAQRDAHVNAGREV